MLGLDWKQISPKLEKIVLTLFELQTAIKPDLNIIWNNINSESSRVSAARIAIQDFVLQIINWPLNSKKKIAMHKISLFIF